MAQKPPRAVIELTEAQKKRLKETDEDVERAEHAIGVLETLGMDVTELKAKIEWAKSAKDLMLKEFG